MTNQVYELLYFLTIFQEVSCLQLDACLALTPSQYYKTESIFESGHLLSARNLGAFLCIGTTLTLASLEAKCRSNPTTGDTAQTSSPEAALCCNDYSINYSWTPAFHMRYPPFFSWRQSSRQRTPEMSEIAASIFQKLCHSFAKLHHTSYIRQKCVIYSTSHDKDWIHEK